MAMHPEYSPAEHNIDKPVEALEVGDLVWSSGYLFEVLELYPVFDTCVGKRRQFQGQAVNAPNGNGFPGGGYNKGCYSTGRDDQAFVYVGPREIVGLAPKGWDRVQV